MSFSRRWRDFPICVSACLMFDWKTENFRLLKISLAVFVVVKVVWRNFLEFFFIEINQIFPLCELIEWLKAQMVGWLRDCGCGWPGIGKVKRCQKRYLSTPKTHSSSSFNHPNKIHAIIILMINQRGYRCCDQQQRDHCTTTKKMTLKMQALNCEMSCEMISCSFEMSLTMGGKNSWAER